MSNVIQNNQDFISIDFSMIEKTKELAKTAKLRRARINLHHNYGDMVQEMIIVLCQNSMIMPHRHVGKTESLHAIQGRAKVFFFDDTGKVNRIFCLGDINTSLPVLYRISSPEWHTIIPLDEFFVVHEISEGPYDEIHNSYPEWGPKSEIELKCFLSKLLTNNEDNYES